MYTFYHLNLTAGLALLHCIVQLYLLLIFQPEMPNFTERLSYWHKLLPSIEVAEASQTKIELEWTEEAEQVIHVPFALE